MTHAIYDIKLLIWLSGPLVAETSGRPKADLPETIGELEK